jgi:arginine/lysine/ornithine decarboxylase
LSFIYSVLVISAGKKRYRTANLNKIRRHYEQDTLRQQIIPDETNRFRHFYHIRRANGDALSSVNLLLTSKKELS